jgi:two-component system LytT family response regulator
MNILIIEDEVVAAEHIQDLIGSIMPQARIVGWTDSIERSIEFLRTQPKPDLILMDIELVDGQCFEIFSEVTVQSAVIFTTAYDEYALQAFQVHSIDYLLKPIEAEQLSRSLQKFSQLKEVYQSAPNSQLDTLITELRRSINPATSVVAKEYFMVRQGQRLLSVNVEEIAYFYTEDRVCFLKTYEGRYFPLDYTLEEIEVGVSPSRFFRANRQYLIGRSAISNTYIHLNGKLKLTLKPEAKEDIYVSRDRAPEFKKWLGA